MSAVKSYLQAIWADALCVVVASVCLAVVAMSGFVIEPSVQFNIALIASLSIALQAILFAGAYRRANMVPAAAAYALASILVVVVAVALSDENFLEDAESTYLYFALVVVIANMGVFLLTRRRAGFVALFAIGLFTCAYIEFVYHAGLAVPSLLFACAAAVLFVFQGYRESVLSAKTVDSVAFGRAALTSAASVGICALAALGVFALIIAPLSPGHLTLKLFTEYRAFETVEANNPVNYFDIEDPEQQTTNITDEVIYGNIPIEVDSDGLSEGATSNFVENAREQLQSQGTYRLESDDDAATDLFRFELPEWWPAVGIALLVLLLVAMALFPKLRRAKVRHDLVRMPLEKQIGCLYGVLEKRVAKLGFGRSPMQTPYEFVESSRARMEAFNRTGEDTSWEEVADAYVKVHYGKARPTGEQLGRCWRFYDAFMANARKEVGGLRYLARYYWTL